MNKKRTVAVIFLLAFTLLMTCAPRECFATDRTPYYGILISAWTCDEASITPAMAKSMIDEAYSKKGIEFEAVKITYGYDPDVYSSSYVAGRINTWVDYFEDYYDHIYVAARTIFHTGEQLTPAEADEFYEDVSDYLDIYPEVECFLGEEEAEAEQSCPHCGDPTGNNLAYDDFDDMVDYIEMLYDTWHSYSDIPFTFESITPANEFWNASGHYYTNEECWFFDEVKVTEYWDFVNAYQDIFALDEWRYHWGVEEWRDHCSVYNQYMVEDKGFFYGETFNLDYTETEDLIDAFLGYGYCDFNYAFWWSLVAVEPIYTQCPDYDDYFYWTGGWEGHAWAHLQKKQWGNCWGSYLGSCNTYSAANDDTAQLYDSIAVNTDSTEEYFRTWFNLDMHTEDTSSGYEAVLGYWEVTAGYWAITAKLESDDDIHFKFYYIYDSWYPAQASYEATDVTIPKNAWVYADIVHKDTYIEFRYRVYFANGTDTGLQSIRTSYDGHTWNDAIFQVHIGAMGGNFVKLYCGEFSYHAPYGNGWSQTFESNNLSGWTTEYDEPSYVHTDDYLVYDNAPHYMLDQIES